MKCARLHLQERLKPVKFNRPFTTNKPRRFCQKRLVDPEHEEDPRWKDVFERYHCDETANEMVSHSTREYEDIYLTVQNLQFQGNEEKRERPRTSFKYKNLTDGNKHRMFVKQIVHQETDDRASQLTCYYYDDYAKYLSNAERSRPSSGKSTIFLQNLNSPKENKATQVEIVKPNRFRTCHQKADRNAKICEENLPETDDTRISFHKSGKRKSLTISRAPSPETVQVIRVDVVCNYPGSSMSDYEDSMSRNTADVKNKDSYTERKNAYASKYLLTNTIKSLEERVSGGAKVTLLCKTFKLSDRHRMLARKKTNDDPKLKDRN